jgi:hypothetical protein
MGEDDDAKAGKEQAETSVPPNQERECGLRLVSLCNLCIYRPGAEIFEPPTFFTGRVFCRI